MLQYILTGLAGIVLGVVAMRVWQAGGKTPSGDATADAELPAEGSAASPSPAASPGPAPSPRITPRRMLIGAGGLAVAAVAVLALRGEDSPAPAIAGTALPGAAAAGKALDDVDTLIGRLATRLKQNPNDGEGWRMLAWSYAMTNRPDQAIEPYKRALALMPNSAQAHSGYGEALVGVAKGTVTPEAKAQFARAVALDPKEPRSLYFLALAQAQNGEERQALEKWITLANSGPADAPWQVDLRRQITQVSGKLGVDVSARLKHPAPAAQTAPASGAPSATAIGATPPPLDPGTVQAAQAMPEAQRQQMVDGMVSGLAEKLKANPADPERWALLLRSRMVLKQPDQARSDLVTARKALAGDASGLARVNAAARDLGVPGA